MKVHVSGDQLHATGSFAVPYVQWGLKDPSTLMLRVNKEVQIDLSLNGTLHHTQTLDTSLVQANNTFSPRPDAPRVPTILRTSWLRFVFCPTSVIVCLACVRLSVLLL
jgi:hypothetical protein